MNKEEMQDIKERLDLFPESMNKEAQEGYYKLFDYINKIEEENKQLKEINKQHQEINGKLREENKRLEKNWNKLREYMNKKEKLTFNSWNSGIHEIQRKMRELEESDK